MKRILMLIAIICSGLTIFSQIPQSFKYQTIVRDADGHPLTNQEITLTVLILQGGSGNVVCNESFEVTTNDFGLVNLEIGSIDTTSFKSIDWSVGTHYLKVILNGTEMGISELLAVPYSLYAKKTREFLPPEMTKDEMLAFENPSNGMIVLCSDCGENGSGALAVYKYGNWFKLLDEIIASDGCPGIPTIEYEGQIYHTVLIGTQCWLKENLNVGTQITSENNQQNNGIIEKYCYNDMPAYCDQFGGLYQWEEVMKYSWTEGTRGICPEGWHIPTNGEWCEMMTYLDPTVNCNAIGNTGTVAGTKMKSTSGWYMGGNGTNESGFTGLPSGTFLDYYDHISEGTNFWTSTSQSGTLAYYWVLFYSNSGTGRYSIELDWYGAVPVRCLKDE